MGSQLSDFFTFLQSCPVPEEHNEVLLAFCKRLFKEGWTFSGSSFRVSSFQGDFRIDPPQSWWDKEHFSKVLFFRTWHDVGGGLRFPRVVTRAIHVDSAYQIMTSDLANLAEVLRD